MKDAFGNTVSIGDRIIYTSIENNDYAILKRGVVDEICLNDDGKYCAIIHHEGIIARFSEEIMVIK